MIDTQQHTNEPERARSAFFCIDSSCPRNEWVRIGMAAKSAGLTFDDFHEWSKASDKYKNRQDCLSTWNSFKADGGVTSSTLFDLAFKSGWQDSGGSAPRKSVTLPHSVPIKKPGANVLQIWETCTPAQSSHPYITRKQGSPDGLRIYPDDAQPLIIKNQNVAGWLVVPVWDDDQLQTMQFISPNGGKKLNLTGESFGAGFFVVGGMPSDTGIDEIYIVEGIGQAWAANAVTKSTAIVALGFERISRVSKLLRAKYPNAQLVILPDRGKEKKAAEIATSVIGCCYATLPDDKPNNYDANDYLLEHGRDPLARLLKQTLEAAKLPGIKARVDASTSFNETLDGEQSYCSVDLLSHVDNNHLLKRLSEQVAAIAYLPANTTFLTGMAAFSAMAARKWTVLYPNQDPLPIGLYVVAEQPSGTGKSRCLKTFQKPFYEARKQAVSNIQEKIKLLDGIEERDRDQDRELAWLKAQKIQLFTTNATAEGLESTLHNTKGFFSAVSSEQGLFNSLFGLSYGATGVNNNDITLSGFDGGHVSGSRITRQGYAGEVIGSVVCFAQHGSIEKVLDASNGTGLSERFLMLAEKHELGQRDHEKRILEDKNLIIDYAKACDFATEILETPKEFDDLMQLSISDSGHKMIAKYRNGIEPHLADGGRYSHISLRGAASKIDMQIMKIAANLHLTDRDPYQPKIPDELVKAAIGIANALLEGNLMHCQNSGIIGSRSEFISILSLFENDQSPRTERNIISIKHRLLPFRDFTGNKSQLIRETLNEMVKQKLLMKVCVDGKTMYQLSQ